MRSFSVLAVLGLCIYAVQSNEHFTAAEETVTDGKSSKSEDYIGMATTVCCGHESHRFACKEMVHYLFLTTGYLPALQMLPEPEPEAVDRIGLGDLAYASTTAGMPQSCTQDAVVLIEKTHPHIVRLNQEVVVEVKRLGDEEHHTRLTQWTRGGGEPLPGNILLVAGGGDDGVKHGTYELLQRYGVHFRIEGDILPSQASWSNLPQPLLNIKLTGTPMFDIRGLQPFHDFPEGPDWWGENQYKSVFTQLSKMRMNFLGLHTYPYSTSVGTGRDEPTVWVGFKEQVKADGSVNASYATSYANTMRNQWGDSALPTGDYHYGAKDIFPTDCYGSEVQVGNCPFPTTPEGNNEVFDKTGAMLKAAFEHAHRLSVKTCVGTETPLSVPASSRTGPGPLNLYYSASRKDHFLTTTKCAECENLYEFVGIQGYVALGPGDGLVPLNTYFNGHLLDNVLSVKPIDGYTFVRTEGYINATQLMQGGHGDVTAEMTSLQIFYNAKIVDHLVAGTDDAKKYALSSGYVLQSTIGMVASNTTVPPVPLNYYAYEGIFTRIMNLGLPIDYYWIWTPEGWEWGKMTETNPVFQEAVNDLKGALAARDALNASFELATCGWVVGPLPDRSIFDKVLPEEFDAITSIDMQVGNTPVDKSYRNITRHKKWAIPWMEDDPGLTAPQLWVNRTLEHMDDAAEYGCNGLLGIHWRTKATSPQIAAMGMKSWDPTLTSEQFWVKWSKAEFGIDDPAAIFARIESFNLPRPVAWGSGPGAWGPNSKQCSEAESAYQFVDELQAMLPKVQGISNQDRYNYWLNSFQYMQGIAMTECAWAEYNTAAAAAAKISDVTQRAEYAKANALPARVQLVANATTTMSYLLQTVSSMGELGTVMNVMSHSLVKAIDQQTQPLLAMLKPVMSSLPAEAMPSDQYTGPHRLIVPTGRTHLTGGEVLSVTAMLLLKGSPTGPCVTTLYWRPASTQEYTNVTMTNIGRQVYQGAATVTQPTSSAPYFYYIGAKCPSIPDLAWPLGAPQDPQPLIID